MNLENYQLALENALLICYQNTVSWICNPDTYYQILLIITAFAFAYLITKPARHFITALKEPDQKVQEFSKIWFLRRAGRLILPLLAIIFLGLARLLFEDNLANIENIVFAQKIILIWILWIIITAFITSKIIQNITLWILIPAFILHLFGWFDLIVDDLNDYGFKLGSIEITAYTFIKAIFFVSIIIWIGKLISSAVEGKIKSSKSIARSTKELLIKLFDIVFYTILLLTTLSLIGIDLTVLAVLGSAIGVGIGFGLQKIASNFISGIILLTEGSININNIVEMNDGTLGYVRKLGARATVIETFDGKEVMVPNEDFITSRVANLNRSNGLTRISIPIGVSYDTDLEKAHELILEAVNSCDLAMKTKEFSPQCYLREYGESSINFMLNFWLEDIEDGKWKAQSDVMFAVWRSFKKHNIEIPFPQRDIHIKSGLDKLKIS